MTLLTAETHTSFVVVVISVHVVRDHSSCKLKPHCMVRMVPAPLMRRTWCAWMSTDELLILVRASIAVSKKMVR